jgi:4,5:9,10-diseco-3-hydroxy-5,9,17-trioxoandrosta-1(10),2-diene-4-oate hydrolase
VAFSEGFVEADGFRIRFMEAGQGMPLIHLHGAGGMRLTRAHALLSRKYRVIVFEMPGFGLSPVNDRTQTLAELAATMGSAVAAMGIDRCNVLATSFGARVALWLALQQPERVQALVLEAPAAIRPRGHQPPSGTPEQIAHQLYAHPERAGSAGPVDPEVQAKQRTLTGRLRGPDRDPDLEARLRELTTPTLVLFGTSERLMPPEMGRHYKTLLPNCHLVFVYDAGHEISTDRPQAFAEVTADFLERHEAFVISRKETLIAP